MNLYTFGVSVLALATSAACDKQPRLSPEERAVKACRGFASKHLIDPASARFHDLEVRLGSGDSHWDVRFEVEGKDGKGETKRERATCRLAENLDLIEIVGE